MQDYGCYWRSEDDGGKWLLPITVLSAPKDGMVRAIVGGWLRRPALLSVPVEELVGFDEVTDAGAY